MDTTGAPEPGGASGPRPRFGVEEEFLVVDPASGAVAPYAGAVVARARERLGERVCGEITEFQVETKTEPCHTLGELHAQLVEGRELLGAAAAAEGWRVIASGTPVLGPMSPPPITKGARQDRGIETFRSLHDEAAICAVHVHVELADRDRAVLTANHLRPYLPTLIALTANSPYFGERDTGYAGWRTIAWQRWPVAGPPPYLTSAAQFDDVVARLLETGALVDTGTLFWDIRPSAQHPTLEIRAADVPMTADESALAAALVRALVETVLPAVDRGDPGPVVAAELLRVAYWRAARDGLDGQGVDVHTGHLLPARDLVARLVETVRPVLERHGEFDQVAAWLRTLTEAGSGAARQRRAAVRRGLLGDVVDHLVGQTAPQEPLAAV